LLFGKLAKGGRVVVSEKDDKLELEIEPPQVPRLSSRKPPLLTAD
jgi:ATP-dependent Clp protease ATP-binding subunit ClpA